MKNTERIGCELGPAGLKCTDQFSSLSAQRFDIRRIFHRAQRTTRRPASQMQSMNVGI
jgi:hypothetical protein